MRDEMKQLLALMESAQEEEIANTIMQNGGYTALEQYASGEKEFITSSMYEALFDLLIHEMPYGVAKARDGDPDTWILDYLESHGHMHNADMGAEMAQYESEELEEAVFHANIDDADYQQIRRASMRGNFNHKFSRKTNGDVRFTTRQPQRLAKDLEKIIDSGETSWTDILDIYGVQKDAAKSDGTPVAYAGGGAFAEEADEEMQTNEAKSLSFKDGKDIKVAQFSKSPSVFVIAKPGKNGYNMFVWDEESGKGEPLARMIPRDAFQTILDRPYNTKKFKMAGGIKQLEEAPGDIRKGLGVAALLATLGLTMPSANDTPLGQAMQQAAASGDAVAAKHLDQLDFYADENPAMLQKLSAKYLSRNEIDEGITITADSMEELQQMLQLAGVETVVPVEAEPAVIGYEEPAPMEPEIPMAAEPSSDCDPCQGNAEFAYNTDQDEILQVIKDKMQRHLGR